MSTLERAEADRDRLAALAERALAGAEEAGQRAAALQSMTDRALALLDRSTAATAAMQEELGRIATDKTNKDAVIATHAAQIDRLFTLSERALEKAAETRRAPSLIARVLGVGRSKT